MQSLQKNGRSWPQLWDQISKNIDRFTLDGLKDFDTALLANTIGYVDPTPPEEYYMGRSIKSITPSLGPTVGIAVTCELDSSTPGNQGNTDIFWHQLEEMSKLDLPFVWVVKTVGSRPDHECVIGDGMAKLLHSVGCVGLVTDGGVRDVSGIMTVPFGVYCQGVAIHHTSLRFLAPYQPVEIGGICIRTGDIMHANNEGVIKIPSACLQQLPKAAMSMRAFESEVHIAWRQSDLSISEKQRHAESTLAKYGFTNCCVTAKSNPNKGRT